MVFFKGLTPAGQISGPELSAVAWASVNTVLDKTAGMEGWFMTLIDVPVPQAIASSSVAR
jgi:hypothetical protein